MIIPAAEPVAFNLFGMPVYWYGVCLAAAIFLSILAGNAILNRQYPYYKKDVIIASAPIIIIAGIAGARLYFCLLNLPYYFTHPLDTIDIRQGGLSIHGALIFGIAAVIFTAKKNQIPVLRLLDAMGCATILGQAIGRWGNYFNSEAYGYPTSGQNWGLFIPESRRVVEYSNYSLFHPAFLYESLLDLLGFFILCFIYFKFGKKYSGLAFFVYLILYSVIRFCTEQIRIDSALNIGNIPIAQIISIVIFIFGVAGIAVLKYRKRS